MHTTLSGVWTNVTETRVELLTHARSQLTLNALTRLALRF
jgi:hypothetical protein